ncbi:MAG: argininosuccinate lyase [Acidobacteriota bacterium]
MKLWQGRLPKVDLDPEFEQINVSIDVDRRLFHEEIEVNIAWAQTLTEVRVLGEAERRRLVKALRQVEGEIESGSLRLTAGQEDIHTAVENRLVELVGPLGGKLRAGRSRNDLVVTDLRLHLKRALAEIAARADALQAAAVMLAEAHPRALMPGYTHLRQAQPILFAHVLMALVSGLERDRGRLADAVRRFDLLPLGCGALAGSGLPVDREALAARLGFAAPSDNSLDTVSDRDFVLEVASALAILLNRLSRVASDLILWSTQEFGFVEIDASLVTGSSLMPQKRNPDALELVRARAGRAVGQVASLLATFKGLPGGYHKDLQEDKAPLFDLIDSTRLCLGVLRRCLESLEVREARMRSNLDPSTLATDLADYLVERGVPFRQAHSAIAGLVSHCERRGLPLHLARLGDLQRFNPALDEKALRLLDPERSIARRRSTGGTAPQSVAAQVRAARRRLRRRGLLKEAAHGA